MFPKAHLTSHSRIYGSRRVTTPSWLFGSLKPFWYSSLVYYWLLFLISSLSVRFLQFLSFIVPILAWNVPFIALIFLNTSLVFTILLLSSISLHFHIRRPFYLSLLFSGTLHSVAYIFPLSPLPFTFLLSSAICKAFSDNHFAFLPFFYLG